MSFSPVSGNGRAFQTLEGKSLTLLCTIIGRALVGYGGWMARFGGQSHGVGAFQYEYEVKLHLSETCKSKFQASNIEYSFRTMI